LVVSGGPNVTEGESVSYGNTCDADQRNTASIRIRHCLAKCWIIMEGRGEQLCGSTDLTGEQR